ncbi:MAG: DUF4998 domain-containing protein [Fulvivirga sp.]
MKKLRIMIISCVVMVALSGIFFACDDPNEVDYSKYKTHYAMIPDSLEILAGENRVNVWAVVNDPEVAKMTVYWNAMTDSLELPVNSADKADTVDVIINDMEEGSHNFTVITYDINGVSSIKLSYTIQVYGDAFISSLVNRSVVQGTIDEGSCLVEWGEIVPADIGVEITYEDQSGTTQEMWVPGDEGLTRFDDYPKDDIIRYRTVFLPENGLDTIFMAYETVQLEPPVPVELDKRKFEELALPTDAPRTKYLDNMLGFWDGIVGNGTNYYGTDPSTGPHWFTFDMGVKAKLNRVVTFHRPGNSDYNLVYNHANVKRWEVWGSADEPAADGSWDGWIKLMDCESIKPSGLPRTELSQEDIQRATVDGESFDVPADKPAVRYIRIKVLETWYAPYSDRCFFGEITIYGIVR